MYAPETQRRRDSAEYRRGFRTVPVENLLDRGRNTPESNVASDMSSHPGEALVVAAPAGVARVRLVHGDANRNRDHD